MMKNANNEISALDELDKSILRIVQLNNQTTHANIGQKIGLSTSAVRRRLTNLRAAGVIKRDVSIVNSSAANITLIVQVSFKDDTAESYEKFDSRMNALANVTQSYHVSGATDYIIIVQGPNLEWYEDWAKENLMSDAAIQRHDTSVVWSCKKSETAVPI